MFSTCYRFNSNTKQALRLQNVFEMRFAQLIPQYEGMDSNEKSFSDKTSNLSYNAWAQMSEAFELTLQKLENQIVELKTALPKTLININTDKSVQTSCTTTQNMNVTTEEFCQCHANRTSDELTWQYEIVQTEKNSSDVSAAKPLRIKLRKIAKET